MLHIKQKSILAAVLLSTSTVSVSKKISYDYIQATYSSVTIDTGTTAGDLDGNGPGISGSLSVTPAIAITAGFGATSFDRLQGIDIDTASLALGVTAHMAIAPNADIFGSFSALRAEFEASNEFITVNDTDIGNVISIGLRFLATDQVELEIGFVRTDVFEEIDNLFGASIRFYASEKFSLGAAYETTDDTDALLLKARIDFK